MSKSKRTGASPSDVLAVILGTSQPEAAGETTEVPPVEEKEAVQQPTPVVADEPKDSTEHEETQQPAEDAPCEPEEPIQPDIPVKKTKAPAKKPETAAVEENLPRSFYRTENGASSSIKKVKRGDKTEIRIKRTVFIPKEVDNALSLRLMRDRSLNLSGHVEEALRVYLEDEIKLVKNLEH